MRNVYNFVKMVWSQQDSGLQSSPLEITSPPTIDPPWNFISAVPGAKSCSFKVMSSSVLPAFGVFFVWLGWVFFEEQAFAVMLFYGFFFAHFAFFPKWFTNVSVIVSFLLKKLCFLKKLQHVRLKCKYPLQGSNKFCATKSLWFLHLIMSHWIIIILFLLVSRTQFSILVLHLIKSASFAAGLVVKLRLTHGGTLHLEESYF